MTIFQMRCFLQVAKLLSFTEAAERMYISQSSLSRNIASIEQELEVRLFDRGNNTILLTSAGKELNNGLEKICDYYDSLCISVKHAALGVSGELRIGLLADQLFDPSVAQTILQFKDECPEISLDINRYGFKELYSGLVDGNLDVAISFKHAMDFDSSIGMVKIAEERLDLAAPKEECAELLPGQDGLALFMDKYPLLTLSLNSYTVHANLPSRGGRDSLYDGFKCRYVEELSSIPLYVSLGVGVTIVNETHILRDDPNIGTIPLDRLVPIVKVLCFNKNNMSTLTERFLKVFEEIRHNTIAE